MKEKLKKIREQIFNDLRREMSMKDLTNLQIRYLGRKGEVTQLLRSIKNMAGEQKKDFGRLANELKREIEEQFTVAGNRIKELTGKKKETPFDPTLPGTPYHPGGLHPVTQMTRLIQQTFSRMNFELVLGPELETDFYNFEALNVPKDHPARDMQDTFYLTEELLLRTHTSPMQVRYMQKHQPPFRIIVTGKCYRRDSDLTHTPMFNQFEGLMIGADVTMEHLKNILKVSMKKILGKEVGVRFRISYFPFVEPGAEFDVTCTICDGLGCATCKHTGWLEMGGCGMVHPNVLTASGVDAEKWQGFAFGFGIERVFMIKHKVNDLRLFFENDVRFLKQF